MKKIKRALVLFLVGLLVLLGVATGVQAAGGPVSFLPFVALRTPDFDAHYDAAEAKAHAQALADMGPRVRGTDVEAEAADYVVAEMESYGLAVEVEPFSFTDGNLSPSARSSQTVVGTLEGREPDAGTMYIGAHYDSVPGSPGGNDNGSGLGTLLEVARLMADLPRPPLMTVKFVAFGAEEGGLYGSRAYVSAHSAELAASAVGMINLDMVGVGDYMSLGTIGVAGTELRDDAGQVATSLGYVWYPFVAEDDSDHAPFERAGVQALFLLQYDDPYYHSANDTAERLDLEVMHDHGVLAAEVLYRWASRAN